MAILGAASFSCGTICPRIRSGLGYTELLSQNTYPTPPKLVGKVVVALQRRRRLHLILVASRLPLLPGQWHKQNPHKVEHTRSLAGPWLAPVFLSVNAK